MSNPLSRRIAVWLLSILIRAWLVNHVALGLVFLRALFKDL